jgi:hypothetical protein
MAVATWTSLGVSSVVVMGLALGGCSDASTPPDTGDMRDAAHAADAGVGDAARDGGGTDAGAGDANVSSVDAFSAADVGVDAVVIGLDSGLDAGSDAFVASDVGTDAFVVPDGGHDAGRDAFVATDANVDASAGSLRCGFSLTCARPAQDCCFGTGSFSCAAAGTCAGNSISCASANDCPAGNICCASMANAVSCQPTCTGRRFCATSAECVSPQTCLVDAFYGYRSCR